MSRILQAFRDAQKRYALKRFDVTADTLYGYLADTFEHKYGKPYVEQLYHKEVTDLLLYFAGIENHSFALNKGVYLWGKAGIGKSCLMRTIGLMAGVALKDNRFKPASATKLALQITDDALTLEVNYKAAVYYDDLGNEQRIVKYYGNEVMPMLEVVLMRYDLWQEQGVPTHFTSNYDLPWMEEHYGKRMADRLREMCSVVELKGNNLRL